MTTIPRPHPAPVLAIALNRVGHRCVLHLTGEIDIADVGTLAEHAADALADGAQELWIDLSDLEFLDVLGVHTLVGLQERAHAQERRLAVICPVSAARRALELTGTADELRLFSSRSEAHLLA